MSAVEIIAIAVGIVNFLALFIIAWQTYLNRKSVQISEKNLLEFYQGREILNLPKANLIIEVQVEIEAWLKDLRLIVNNKKLFNELIKGNDTDIKVDTSRWIGQSKGLISRGLYDILPDWLKDILMAGVQYYYQGMCMIDYVCSMEKGKEFRLGLLDTMVSEAEHGINALETILAYINKLVPKWYLECPASLNDSDFIK